MTAAQDAPTIKTDSSAAPAAIDVRGLRKTYDVLVVATWGVVRPVVALRRFSWEPRRK